MNLLLVGIPDMQQISFCPLARLVYGTLITGAVASLVIAAFFRKR